MRVISGSAGGKRLSAPKGNRVRPTADRVKEALFSILLSRFGSFDGLSVLDLFAGTGNLGIEALSRGADCSVFVDSHRQSADAIRANLIHTDLLEKGSILISDVLVALNALSKQGRTFDIVFMDPPYQEQDLINSALDMLSANRLIHGNGLIVLESSAKFIPKQHETLLLQQTRRYGDSAIHLLEQTDI